MNIAIPETEIDKAFEEWWVWKWGKVAVPQQWKIDFKSAWLAGYGQGCNDFSTVWCHRNNG